MKIKRKTFIVITIILFFVICLTPVKRMRKLGGNDDDSVFIISHEEGGGTYEYCAIFYKVVVWNDLYLEHPYDSTFKSRTGTDFYIFPFNFGQKEWHSS